jgi:hypothetical protein
MKTIVIFFLATALAFCVVAAEPQFDCTITSDRTTYEVGEVPKITFLIVNKSGKDVVLVGSLDGSDVGWRFPKCRLEILDKGGRPVTNQVLRCGNMNTLKTNDFVLVPAGENFNPFGKGFFRPAELVQFPVTTPGEYIFRFNYSTSNRLQDYFGDEANAAPEIQRLFERVPKLELKSNELKLKFTAKAK